MLKKLKQVMYRFRLTQRLVNTTGHEELLLHNSLWKVDFKGTMVDVGAHFGSSLRPFALDGWSIFALEPDPKNRLKLSALASRLPGILIDPRAVTESDNEELQLFQSDISTGISSLVSFHSSHVPTASVKTTRLDSFCLTHGITKIDFLKIDVEGYDLFALRSHDWTIRPDVVMCEFEDNKTRHLGHDTLVIGKYLESKGYKVVVSEWNPIVEYGGQHTWRRAYRFGENKIPENSWGNLIGLSNATQVDRVMSAFQSWNGTN